MDSVVVHPQIPSVGKSLSALVAGERPLPHVNVALVGSEVPAAGEALAALGAAKRSLPRVCAGVHRELRGSQEALFTELAGVQPDPRVPQKMPALVGGVGETLGAVRAGVRPSAPRSHGRRAHSVRMTDC